ncbi:MAG: hypothetical protein C0615_01580 [Desulfuromonas sp.]|nr:MAG: hypothetical protein C0615_01580 [Desulfuromonas sp.]
MLPIRWDPFRDLGMMHRELDDLFRQTFGGAMTEAGTAITTLTPVVNTFTKDNVYHLQAELPGIDKDDLDISVDENLLTIKGERKEVTEKEERDYMLKESRYGSFVRKMTLPDGADTEKVEARYEDGILEITMPIVVKKASASRKISVEGTVGKGRKVH